MVATENPNVEKKILKKKCYACLAHIQPIITRNYMGVASPFIKLNEASVSFNHLINKCNQYENAVLI